MRTGTSWLPVVAAAALLLAAPACGGGEDAAVTQAGNRDTSTAEAPDEPTTTELAVEPAPAQPGLPPPVATTRDAILAAAADGDYDALRTVIDAGVFLSDFGFGREPDPAARWEELGPLPLQTMDALLRMDYVVRETNEGTLYQWPSYDQSSTAEDITPADRELFLTVMSEEEVNMLAPPEYGYTAPRLGILANGTWWFFVTERGP